MVYAHLFYEGGFDSVHPWHSEEEVLERAKFLAENVPDCIAIELVTDDRIGMWWWDRPKAP